MPTNSRELRSDDRDYILDLSSVPQPATDKAEDSHGPTRNSKVPHLSIHFKCCNVYAPIYRNAQGTAYDGHCPRCAKPLRIPIAPGGTTARIFEAG